MNLILQGADGRCLVKDIIVTVDPAALQSTLSRIFPANARSPSSPPRTPSCSRGTATDSLRLDQILTLAYAYAGDNKRVVNLMAVGAPQQVMLEVTIAEVGKSVLDNLDVDFTRMLTTADGTCRGSSPGSSVAARRPGPVQPEPRGGAISNNATGLTTGATRGGDLAAELAVARLHAARGGREEARRPGARARGAEHHGHQRPVGQLPFGRQDLHPVAQNQNGTGTTITLEERSSASA
jgi:pilus assembly protein CpaC